MSDTQFELLSLMYGAPKDEWAEGSAFYNDGSREADRFRAVVWMTLGSAGEYGVSGVARAYTKWYQQQEQANESR